MQKHLATREQSRFSWIYSRWRLFRRRMTDVGEGLRLDARSRLFPGELFNELVRLLSHEARGMEGRSIGLSCSHG